MPSNAQNLNLQLTASDYNGYNISCFGGRDGAIDLTITGSTPPYRISWSTRDTIEDLTSHFIKTHKHLPGMKPAAEIETEGQPLGEIQKQQQEHIEKLYLYILQLEQRIEELEKRK